MKKRQFFLSPEDIKKKDQRPRRESKKTPDKVYDCTTCGLWRNCRTPKVPRFGEGRKKILIVGLCPGGMEDRHGKPFVGPSGDLLERTLRKFGVDMDRDCWRTNVVACYPGKDDRGKDRAPVDLNVRSCRKFLMRDIEECDPELIICMGSEAVQSVIRTESLRKLVVSSVHGLAFPYQKLNCWVGCSFHPSYILRGKGRGETDDEQMFVNDIGNILGHLGKPLPKPLDSSGNYLVTDADEAVAIIHDFCASEEPVAFDYETNRKTPYEDEAMVLCVSMSNSVEDGVCIPIDYIDTEVGVPLWTDEERDRVVAAWIDFIRCDVGKVVQNMTMEYTWSKVIFGFWPVNIVHDTMVGAHVIHNRKNNTSLGFQAFHQYGADYKEIVDTANLEKFPIEDYVNYSCWDSRYTKGAYDCQKEILENGEQSLRDFWEMYFSGSFVLARMTHRGVQVDMDVLRDMEETFSKEREESRSAIAENEMVIRFSREHGNKEFNPGSPKQLAELFFKKPESETTYYDIQPVKMNKTDPSTDAEVLEFLAKDQRTPDGAKEIIDNLLHMRLCKSILERVESYKKLVDKNGRIHPTYNLNIIPTYRSSASSPNIQNLFKHCPKRKVFRKCVVPC